MRDLEERTLLDVATGMTAHEAAHRAASSFPDLRGRLQRAADAFDTAAYSVRTAGPKQAEDLLRLAEYIAETAPDLTAMRMRSRVNEAEALLDPAGLGAFWVGEWDAPSA